MPIADCRLPNEKLIGLRPYKARCRAPLAFPLPYIHKHSAIGIRQSAFTLIELMVAVGLMAILLTMIAFIFYEATQAFRAARASIEIHESARSALNALVSDLTAAEFAAYDNGVQGYFALSQGPTDPATGSAPPAWNLAEPYAVNNRVISGGNEYICVTANTGQQPSNVNVNWQLLGPWPVPIAANGTRVPVDTMTFTTLAPQPGARDAAPEAIQQLALVRYALEWDGGYATVPGGPGPQPTYNLVKRVRFPCTSDPNLNMDQFGWAVIGPNGQPVYPYQYLLPLEYQFHTSPPLASTDPDVILDSAGLRYAQSEVIAFHVLSMNIRLFCLPMKNSNLEALAGPAEAFVEAGFATSAANPASLTDTTKNWLNPPLPPPAFNTFNLRITAGTGSGQWATISNTAATPPMLTLTSSTTAIPPTGNLTNPVGNPAITNWTTILDTTSQYRVDGTLLSLFTTVPAPPVVPVAGQPAWCQREWVSPTGVSYYYNFLGTTYRPPAAVEVTLEMTDLRATRAFTFTQRFYIPASER